MKNNFQYILTENIILLIVLIQFIPTRFLSMSQNLISRKNKFISNAKYNFSIRILIFEFQERFPVNAD